MRLQFALILILTFLSASVFGEEWTRFRGPNGTGVAANADIPTTWAADKNLRWKAKLPGGGTSSPITVGSKVFVTCYTGYGLDASNPGNPENLVRHLIAFDRKTGEELWRRSVASTEQELPYLGFVTQHGYASSTPATDGNHVYVLFGKSGLFCFDLDGNEKWKTSLGTKSDPARWGDGTSPIIVDELVVVNAGILGNQFIAINKSDGSTTWKHADPSYTNCWSTPTVVNASSGKQVLFAVPGKIVAVDIASGKKAWEQPTKLNDSTCGSIVAADDKAYLMGSRAGNGIAISAGKDKADVVWERSIRSGIDTPLLLDNQLYWHSNGILFAADANNGEYVYRQRLSLYGKGASFPNVDYSSPVAANGNVIFFMRNGESFVVKSGKKFEVVAHNPAFDGDDSAFSSTPAIDRDLLLIRSAKYLYAIGE